MRKMKLLTGMGLMIVIVLSWYLPAVLRGGQDFLNQTLFHQTIERFAKGTSHIRPSYYYFINFPVDFLPWFLFLPGAFVYGLSKRREGIPKDLLFLLVWFAVIFLFFTFSKGKRALYLLPLYPAASLLVGRFWDDYLSGSGRFSVRKIWITVPVCLFIAVFLLIGLFLLLAPSLANLSPETFTPKLVKNIVKGVGEGARYLSYVPRWSVIFLLALLVGSDVLLCLAQGLRSRFFVFVLIVATAGVGFFYTTRVIFPLVNPYKSARFISQEITQARKACEKLIIYGDTGSAGTAQFNFYTGIVPILETEDEQEMIEYLRLPEKMFCLVNYEDYGILINKYPGLSLRLITRRSVGSRDVVLVSNR